MVKKIVKQENALVVQGEFELKNLPKYVDIINEKLAELDKGVAEPYKTSGKLGDLGNVHAIDNPNDLIQAYAAISRRAESYKKAAKAMGIDKPDVFKLRGFIASEWHYDIIKRHRTLKSTNERSQLLESKSELEKHLSKGDKVKAVMGNLVDIFNK